VAALHVAMCYLLLIYDLDAHHICERHCQLAAYRKSNGKQRKGHASLELKLKQSWGCVYCRYFAFHVSS